MRLNDPSNNVPALVGRDVQRAGAPAHPTLAFAVGLLVGAFGNDDPYAAAREISADLLGRVSLVAKRDNWCGSRPASPGSGNSDVVEDERQGGPVMYLPRRDEQRPVDGPFRRRRGGSWS